MKKKKKQVIFSNYYDEWAEWAEELHQENPEWTDEEVWENIYAEQEWDFDDLIADTKGIKLDILILGDIGRWNGRFSGYKTVDELSDIFYTECVYAEWYIDQYNQFRFNGSHHDGDNHYLYRIINPGISWEVRERLLDSIGTDKEDYYIKRYTTSLGRWYRKKVLGYNK